MTANTIDDLWRAYGDSLDLARPVLRLLRDTRLGAANAALRKLSRGVLAEAVFAVPSMTASMGCQLVEPLATLHEIPLGYHE